MIPLRSGRDEDASGIIALIGACWAEYPGCVLDVDGEVPELRALASHYRARSGRLWVAEWDGALAGMVAVTPGTGGTWELGRMYVSRSRRGTGLAQALLAAATAQAASSGATRLELWTDTRFERAHRFYAKAGFVRSGPIRALDDIAYTLEYRYGKPLGRCVVERLDAAGAVSAEPALAAILCECVAAGAAISFLAPLDPEKARRFWRDVASEAAQANRMLFAA
ncbi:MAG: GNAT family N-acetyltransferase, partial [Janthinobacterium lividum]